MEQDGSDATLIAEAFSVCRRRCNVTRVIDLESARRALGTRQFHLVIVNVSGSAEGIELIRFIRSQPDLRATPIVALGDVDDLKAYDAGANCLVTKPTQSSKLLGNMRSIISFWIGVAELPTGMAFRADSF